MPAAALPPDEKERLLSLRALQQLDTPLEERFDRLTRLAKMVMHVPIAVISLVDEDRQWFKSCIGLDVAETPRTVSFCGHAILRDEIMVVTDATTDPRVLDSPLVTGPPHIRFYVGQPLLSSQNHKIGTLCVIDTKPRTITSQEIDAIKDLGFLVERELRNEGVNLAQRELILELDEAKRKALIDPLTRLWNRDGIAKLLEKRKAYSEKSGQPFVVAMLDLDHFKEVNDNHGHLAGDKVLVEVARRLRGGAREFDTVGRYGGEEFIIVMPDVDKIMAGKICNRILEKLRDTHFETGEARIPVQASMGYAVCDQAQGWDTEAAIQAADKALYEAKATGRNRIVAAP